jgi:hypothetical protein
MTPHTKHKVIVVRVLISHLAGTSHLSAAHQCHSAPPSPAGCFCLGGIVGTASLWPLAYPRTTRWAFSGSRCRRCRYALPTLSQHIPPCYVRILYNYTLCILREGVFGTQGNVDKSAEKNPGLQKWPSADGSSQAAAATEEQADQQLAADWQRTLPAEQELPQVRPGALGCIKPCIAIPQCAVSSQHPTIITDMFSMGD